MVHMDVKKVGKIPEGGGGGPTAAAARRLSPASAPISRRSATPTSTRSSTDSPAWPTPRLLKNETAATTIAFFHRARAFFAAHGITRITRLITDNGANYTSKAFHRSTCAFIRRHQRTRIYTPRHNGKIERYQRQLTR